MYGTSILFLLSWESEIIPIRLLFIGFLLLNFVKVLILCCICRPFLICLPDVFGRFFSHGNKVRDLVRNNFYYGQVLFCFFWKRLFVQGAGYLVKPYGEKPFFEFFRIILLCNYLCFTPHLEPPGICHIAFAHGNKNSETDPGVSPDVFQLAPGVCNKVHMFSPSFLASTGVLRGAFSKQVASAQVKQFSPCSLRNSRILCFISALLFSMVLMRVSFIYKQ